MLSHVVPAGSGAGGSRLQSAAGSARIGPVVVCLNVFATPNDQSYETMLLGAVDVVPLNVHVMPVPLVVIEQVSVSLGPLTPKCAVAVVGLVTDNTADADAPPYDALIVTGIVPPTTRVEIMNVELVDPAGTVTDVGTLAGSPPESVTTAPPVCAAAVNVTAPVTDSPPTIVGDPRVSDASAADVVGDVVPGGVVEPEGDGAVGELPQWAVMTAASASARASSGPMDGVERNLLITHTQHSTRVPSRSGAPWRGW